MVGVTVTRLIEIITLSAVVLTALIVVYTYHDLPESIPAHFSFSGKPDAYNGKESIWLIPVMNVIIYIVLSSITLLVRLLKRPDEITTEVMVMVAVMIRQMNLLFSVLFLFLVTGTIRISLGKTEGLGVVITPLFLILMAVVVIGNVVKIVRKQRGENHTQRRT
jgi:uncharacterized membrane protein